VHCRPKPGIQSCGDPCCAEVAAFVEVREGFGGLEADDAGEVAGGVEGEGEDYEGAPDGETAGEVGGEAADGLGAVRVGAGEVDGPEEEDSEDLVLAEAGGGAAEDVVLGGYQLV